MLYNYVSYYHVIFTFTWLQGKCLKRAPQEIWTDPIPLALPWPIIFKWTLFMTIYLKHLWCARAHDVSYPQKIETVVSLRRPYICFCKGASALGFFIYTLISICMYVYIDPNCTPYWAFISATWVPDVNLFCSGTFHKIICGIKVIDGTVVRIGMEGILVLIVKCEKLVLKSLQKPQCNRGKRKSSCLQQEVVTICSFAEGLFPLRLTVTDNGGHYFLIRHLVHWWHSERLLFQLLLVSYNYSTSCVRNIELKVFYKSSRCYVVTVLLRM